MFHPLKISLQMANLIGFRCDMPAIMASAAEDGKHSASRTAIHFADRGCARVEERTNYVKRTMAKDMLYVPLRLIQSALGQKAEVKLLGRSQRERSQHRAVMGGDEVANLPGKVGSPVGWRPERASTAGAKFDPSAFHATGRAAAHAVSGARKSLVRPAITSCIQSYSWFVSPRKSPGVRSSLGR